MNKLLTMTPAKRRVMDLARQVTTSLDPMWYIRGDRKGRTYITIPGAEVCVDSPEETIEVLEAMLWEAAV